MGNHCCRGRKETRHVGDIEDNELRVVFNEFDLDGDGYIREEDLKLVMAKMGQKSTPEEVHSIFFAVDANQDGRIDFEEFMAIAKVNPLSLSFRAVFKQMDVDGDGYITKTEMQSAFDKLGQSMTDEEMNVVFSQCDLNHNGKICFDGSFEFWKDHHTLRDVSQTFQVSRICIDNMS